MLVTNVLTLVLIVAALTVAPLLLGLLMSKVLEGDWQPKGPWAGSPYQGPANVGPTSVPCRADVRSMSGRRPAQVRPTSGTAPIAR